LVGKGLTYYLIKNIEGAIAKILDIKILTKAVEGVDEIYHEAGLVIFEPGDKEIFLQTNREGTTNMIQLAMIL
jgi:nucleoside-diphosphate-sugar epimerase